MILVRVDCCPLCGHPLRSSVNGEKAEHTFIEGFSISYAHYPAGFAGSAGRPKYAERVKFSKEVCESCARDIRELMEPLIRLIHDKEIGR